MEITRFSPRGPWPSKSGGQLTLLNQIPLPFLSEDFFRYDQEELGKIPVEMRGLRHYVVPDMPLGGVGGMEFHRLRQELFFTLSGVLGMTCENLAGEVLEWQMPVGFGVQIKPFIMHTITALEPGSGFLVVANTLFDPDDPRTHDTYSMTEFRRLQQDML